MAPARALFANVDRMYAAARRVEQADQREERLLRKRDRRKRRRWSARCPWSELLERAFGEGGLVCPNCRGGLTLRTLVLDPVSAAYIRSTLARSARAGPLSALVP